MKRSVLSVLLLTAICFDATAQKAAKCIFFELGGPGIASANFDMRVHNRNDGFGFRFGIGGFSINDNFYDQRTSIVTLPMGVNYLMGKDNKHFFEVGGGFTYVLIKNKSNFYGDEQFAGSFGHLHFGYRLQPVDGGFTFRAGITPIFNRYGFVPYYFSLSFGYKF